MLLERRKDSDEFVEILYTDSAASFTAEEKGQGISFDAHLKFKCVRLEVPSMSRSILFESWKYFDERSSS